MSKWINYKVRAGKHSSALFGYKVYWGKLSMDFSFQTNKTWLWDNVSGISKVYGLSSGMHQVNSMRLGYRCVDGVMWAYSYSYHDGERESAKLCTLEPDREYKCRISVEDGFWVIRIGDSVGRHPFGRRRLFGFRCHPYVGGTYTLNKDWNVRIREY